MGAPLQDPLVACGMYAFSPALRNAWRELLVRLPEFLSDGFLSDGFLADGFLPGAVDGRINLAFRSDDEVYRDPALLLGHTCGYPYLKKWARTHRPVCAPCFAVAGCEHTQYCSWFITPATGTLTDLASARARRVAVNNPHSNSGMNVLRHAVAKLAGGKRFFSEVIPSGSHLQSLELVANGEADLAAIDAVTYALKIAEQPRLEERVRIIGRSASTTALPFIAPLANTTPAHCAALTEALTRCLGSLDETHRRVLPVGGFQQVAAADYAGVDALETFAQARGYPNLV